MSTEYRSEPDGAHVCTTFWDGAPERGGRGACVDFGTPEREADTRVKAADPFYRFTDEYGTVYSGEAFLAELADYTVVHASRHMFPAIAHCRYVEIAPGVLRRPAHG